MLSPQAAVNANKAATPALPQPAAPRSSAGPSFAQMLTVQAPPPATPQAQPQAAAPAAPRPSAAPAPHEATAPQETPQPGTGAAATAKPATPAKPGGNGSTKPSAQAQGKSPADAGKPTEVAAVDKAASDDKAQPATDGLNEFASLIGLSTPGAAPVDAAAAAAAAAAQAALQAVATKAPADDATEPAAATATDARSSRRAGDAGQAVRADAATTARPAGLADTLDAKAGHAAEATKDVSKTLDTTPAGARPHAATDAALPSFAASLQAAVANTAPAAGTEAATAATIASPPQSAAFAPEVATRVSLMAVDGVQHAELQLNPADMGPVAVQIVVDGSQAQVSFHAAQAETRQALEQSLPDLAAALQGQGLTLSGGGVFQQAPQQQPGGNDTSAERGSGTAGSRLAGIGQSASGSSIDTQAARRTVGLLDTFA